MCPKLAAYAMQDPRKMIYFSLCQMCCEASTGLAEGNPESRGGDQGALVGGRPHELWKRLANAYTRFLLRHRHNLIVI